MSEHTVMYLSVKEVLNVEVYKCIPIRYVCDQVTDCPGGEDEHNCDLFTCPGLLCCKIGSCIHLSNMV